MERVARVVLGAIDRRPLLVPSPQGGTPDPPP